MSLINPNFPTLPPELFHSVIDFVPPSCRINTLYNLSLVSQYLRDIAQPLLWRDLVVTSLPDQRRICASPCFGSHTTRSIKIDRSGTWENQEGLELDVMQLLAGLKGFKDLSISGGGKGWVDLAILALPSLSGKFALHWTCERMC